MKGARAEVYLFSEKNLRMLASQLTEDLLGVEFYLDTDMDPPHSEVAMCEALGFQVWLNHSELVTDCNYALKLETIHCHEEIMQDSMYDLSPWLAKYLKDIGNFKVFFSKP